MHEEDPALIEHEDQVLGATLQPSHSTSNEVLGEPIREREAEVRSPKFNGGDANPHHMGKEAAPDRFNLWKFGHQRVASSRRVRTSSSMCEMGQS